MAKATAPRIAADQISFELDRFEHGADRLELSGRWFGVRGRRFVRPTLTPVGAGQRARVLADLEHKPWAAEDGERWEATFPWMDGAAAKFELSVAPDIAIQLPAPGGRLARPRRLAALPRQPIASAVHRATPHDAVEPVPAPEFSEPKLRESSLRDTRQELDTLREELKEARASVAEKDQELETLRGELDALRAELLTTDQLVAQSDRASAERDQLARERDRLTADCAQLTDERDRATAEHAASAGERDQAKKTIAEIQLQLEQVTQALAEAARQRDEALTAHGAALVMRRAAGSPPSYAPPAAWWKSLGAVLALLAMVAAVLVIAHVL